MATLKFNQNELVNLEYSLAREFLSTNRAGGYMSSTITCCNTRKYHGLMVCPKSDENTENYVFVSSLDETIIQHGKQFNLALHKFKGGSYEPKGHKYITDFDYSPTPAITYRVGGVELKKELLWLHTHKRLLIRYTLLDATSETILRVRPLLAFRSVNAVSKANMLVCGASQPINGGVKNRLYDNFPWLYLQVNSPSEFVPAPDWYYDFEYSEEAERGYECNEDLFTTGFFDIPIVKGQSIVMAFSFREVDPSDSAAQFERELSRRTKKTEFVPCLEHSARQFITARGGRLELSAGFHWYGERSRDTFIALSGCTLSQGLSDDCIAILHNKVSTMRGGLFEDESADTSLWFFSTLQQLEDVTSDRLIWENFSVHMKSIINAYIYTLQDKGIVMHSNGLIWAKREGVALTWMNGYYEGMPVTERGGYQVEVNALWYNAICYTLELAHKFNDKEFITKYESLPALIKKSFLKTFWIDKDRYLADYVCDDVKNLKIRPNQIIACGLRYSMLDSILAKEVINCVEKYLLTPKGLRSLSPNDLMFAPECSGDENSRNLAYHNGSVWSWLLLYFLTSNRKVYGSEYQAKAKDMIEGFKEDFLSYGIGTLPELYDANPPYQQRGAISFASSVGTLLRMIEIAEYGK